MPTRDGFADRGRSLEEDYFLRKDRELIENIRRKAELEQARADLGRKAGLDDPQLISQLQELGFTVDTVALLPLAPLVETAWAEGGVSSSERDLIISLARRRGIVEGSPADHQLTSWLAHTPPESLFSGARRLIAAMLESGSEQTAEMSADDLVRYCEQIAAASGGLFGIGRISTEERGLLTSIAADLKARRT